MITCQWIEILGVGIALVGAIALVFGLKIKEGISKDLKHLVQEDMIAPTQAEQRKLPIWIGLALLVCAFVLAVYTIKYCDRDVVATEVGNDAPDQSMLAEESNNVPHELFGITLGGIYDLGDPIIKNNDFGDLPVKKIVVRIPNLFRGGWDRNVYFQPTKEYTTFEYSESRYEKYVESNFMLHMLPVIPSTVTTYDQILNTRTNWEVLGISWYRGEETTDGRSSNLCKTFKEDLSVEPDVTESEIIGVDVKCTFKSGDRELKVSDDEIVLSFNKEVRAKKREAVEKIGHKLIADDIRPYKRP